MAAIDLWAEGQRSMSALGRTLEAADGDRPVPACPDWTVRDVYAHQAGVATDLLAGRVDGAGTDPWTAQQVADRADRSLTELLDEWDAAAPTLVAALRPLDEDIDPRLIFDLWHHHQDVRGAVGLPGETTGPVAEWVIDRSSDGLRSRVAGAGLDLAIGPAPATPTPGVLTVEPFEAVRAVVGRRSLDQIRAWSWGLDDPDDLAATVPAFGPRADALVEAASP